MLRLPCRLLVRVINQIVGEVAGVRGEDGSCANVTGHAVTNELGEAIVTAQRERGSRKFEGV